MRPGTPARVPGDAPGRPAGPDSALAELIDRVLDRGVVVKGQLVISVAGVDLLYVGLDIVLSSVETLRRLAEPPDIESSER